MSLSFRRSASLRYPDITPDQHILRVRSHRDRGKRALYGVAAYNETWEIKSENEGHETDMRRVVAAGRRGNFGSEIYAHT